MTRLKINQDMNVEAFRGGSVPMSETYFEMKESESVKSLSHV